MAKDVLIIGAGGAGLVAALKARECGANVKVITKEYPTRSQTCMAQGGINAAFANSSKECLDNVEDHIRDTLKSAHGLSDEKAVRFMCENAIPAVEWLDSIGLCFSRTKDYKIAQRTLGGASAPRACYAQDYTGLKMLHTLYDRCLKENIEILNEKYLLELIVKEDTEIEGAIFLDIRSGEIEIFKYSSIIIATGGYSRVYDKYSTNSTSSTGDAIATAFRAGVNLIDMEFIQFHPTALKGSSILISESARGAGGYLVNSKGERFTNELAPRDEVSRAIYQEIEKGEEIFLDIRHLGEDFIDKELPQERKLAKLYEGIDPVSELIPIKPSAHYTMGGIEVDENSMTNIKGLFAVGECANHRVHGANRLGGNSLLELVVFAKKAGQNAVEFAKNADTNFDDNFIFKDLTEDIRTLVNEIDFYSVKKDLGECFYKNVGIMRNAENLQKASIFVDKYIKNLHLMGIDDKSKIYNTNMIEFLEFKNMLEISRLILHSALKRKESRGAHFREDFPQELKEFKKNISINKKEML